MGVNVMREGRLEPLVCTCPDLTSAAVGWSGIALESHSIQSCVTPRHEHVENFLLVVLDGADKCEVHTRAKQLEFDAGRGITFILPKGQSTRSDGKAPRSGSQSRSGSCNSRSGSGGGMNVRKVLSSLQSLWIARQKAKQSPRSLWERGAGADLLVGEQKALAFVPPHVAMSRPS
jgi:hypothetical protein